jgi:hypothetical protein
MDSSQNTQNTMNNILGQGGFPTTYADETLAAPALDLASSVGSVASVASDGSAMGEEPPTSPTASVDDTSLNTPSGVAQGVVSTINHTPEPTMAAEPPLSQATTPASGGLKAAGVTGGLGAIASPSGTVPASGLVSPGGLGALLNVAPQPVMGGVGVMQAAHTAVGTSSLQASLASRDEVPKAISGYPGIGSSGLGASTMMASPGGSISTLSSTKGGKMVTWKHEVDINVQMPNGEIAVKRVSLSEPYTKLTSVLAGSGVVDRTDPLAPKSGPLSAYFTKGVEGAKMSAMRKKDLRALAPDGTPLDGGFTVRNMYVNTCIRIMDHLASLPAVPYNAAAPAKSSKKKKTASAAYPAMSQASPSYAPAAPTALPGMQILTCMVKLPVTGGTGTIALPDGNGNFSGNSFRVHEVQESNGGVWTCIIATRPLNNPSAQEEGRRLRVSGGKWTCEGFEGAMISWN